MVRLVGSDADRRRRLTIIVAFATVIIVAPTILFAIGSRAANKEISRVRGAASTAVVTAADFAASACGGTGDDPLAVALDVRDEQVSGFSATGAEWCVTVDVDRFLVTRSIRFRLDASGRLSEVPSCVES